MFDKLSSTMNSNPQKIKRIVNALQLFRLIIPDEIEENEDERNMLVGKLTGKAN